MEKEGYFRIISVAIGSGVATKIEEYFTKIGISPVISLIISIGIAVVVYELLIYSFIEIPHRFYFLRRLIDPISRFEGRWIQTIDKRGERFYSYVDIYYNPQRKNYVISGIALDSKGKIHSTWGSTKLNIDLEASKILYFYTAEMCDGTGETIDGYGEMNFHRDSKGRYTRGIGFFVDSGTQLVQCYYSLDRLTEEDINNLIGSTNVSSNEDLKRLIRKYHEKYGDNRTIS